MIIKVNFSRSFLLLFIGAISFSCSKTTTTFSYTETYKGFSTQGVPSRAVSLMADTLVVGGHKGTVSFHLLNEGNLSQLRNQLILGAEDFRDVHCSLDGTCLFMNSGSRGTIYQMNLEGNVIKVLNADSVFLDGMSFWDDQNGIVYGDPVNGKFFLSKTENGGESWISLDTPQLPDAIENEAGFAASGTGIQTIGDSIIYFATGLGNKARIFQSSNRGETWSVKKTPLKSGDGSFGIYSMYFWNEMSGMIIGGSYLDSTYSDKMCYTTRNGGKSWSKKSRGLPGYCSCIQGNETGSVLIATGRMGTYYTLNKGLSWSMLTSEPFYTCYMTEDYIILSGSKGKLAVYQYKYTRVITRNIGMR